ncbi:hypothetical protein KIW84_072243 [Lathyrus oleraceus]|uniref:Uncharacterized protein n=1 Tax=Pisum sativum TaxID=3888 RepID=A0A9D4ZUU7_PEA|nr:hypothetical protein KIW84_072243 [Pisum sativum]
MAKAFNISSRTASAITICIAVAALIFPLFMSSLGQGLPLKTRVLSYATLLFGFYMAWNIGAHDVSNAIGPLAGALAILNSSMATSSNATSDRVTLFAHDTEGIDHSQDDMASETDKMLYSDLHEEVFAFDKIDGLDANIEHEIDKESVDLLQNQNKGPNIVFGPTDAEGNECSETSHVGDVISETGSFENTAICSQCGCCYQVIIQTEENIELYPQCSRKTTLLRANLPETVLAVSEGSSEIPTNMPKEEENSTAETGQLRTASELSQFPLGEHGYDESETSCSKLNRVQPWHKNRLAVILQKTKLPC